MACVRHERSYDSQPYTHTKRGVRLPGRAARRGNRRVAHDQHDGHAKRHHDHEGVDLALVDTTAMADATVKACILEFTRLKIPTIALVPEHGVGMFDPSLPFADVMVVPARPRRDHSPRKAALEFAAGEER